MNLIHLLFPACAGITSEGVAWGILCLALLSFCFIMSRRVYLLVRARKDPRFNDLLKRLKGLIADGFLQRRQPRYLQSGVIHLVIFWGFMILGLRSVHLILVGLFPGHVFSLMTGSFGAAYNFLKDIVEIATFAACAAAIRYRACAKPERYRDSHQLEAYLVLSLICSLMLTDLLFEASGMQLEPGSFGSAPVAYLFSMGLSRLDRATLSAVHQAGYWLHLICFYFFLNLLPLSKHFHIITALPNVFFRKLNRGELKPLDYDSPDAESAEQAGVGAFSAFTWKNVLDFYSCTECGRCTDNCPAWHVGRNLSPKRITLRLRDHGYRKAPLFPFNRSRTVTEGQSIIDGGVVGSDELWACTTCGACEEQCPVFIEHVDKIIDMRRYQVLMKSDFPPEILPMFRNLEIYGDPWGMGSVRRTEWAAGLDIVRVGDHTPVDIVYWVGCSGAFDERYKQVTASLARVMKHANINFGILGTLERCCGDFARRMGNEFLFQKLAKENIDLLKRHGVKKIVTACPHGYNTLKNEYPRFGGDFEVLHHTEFLSDLIDTGVLKPIKPVAKKITYHDSCYLGRMNGLYGPPRKILSRIPEVTLIEAGRCKEKGFCCGAGGGYMWLVEHGRRINETRAIELADCGSDWIVTACPFCLYMIQEGLTAKQGETGKAVQVFDLSEIVEKTLGAVTK